MSRLLALLAALSILVPPGPAKGAEEPPRFEARLADGARVEGRRLRDWYRESPQPKLDDTPLWDAARPLLWLRDRSLSPAAPPEAFVETISGDRLPGVVLGFRLAEMRGGLALPDCFLVDPRVPLGPLGDEVRRNGLPVVARFVRRIVWQRRTGEADTYEPGTIHFRDGRRVRYRALRFERDSVRLLAESGLARAALDEIAEVDLAAADPWDAYFDELAALDPALGERLVQLETVGGLRITGSRARFRCFADGDAGNSDNWWHGLQPAWCPHMIWVPHATIRIRRSFAPHEVPLSRIAPQKATVSGMVNPAGRAWQADRAVGGGALRSGGEEFGWGLGVHAYTSLDFPLPAAARSFRTRLGLDGTAGMGGCVGARICVGSPTGRVLYESPVMVGSGETCDSGELPLGPAAGGGRSLVLVADPVPGERPADADPLDVRDMLDWLEPVVKLDPSQLSAEVDKRRFRAIPAWQGWQVATRGDGAVRLENRWGQNWPPRGRFFTTVLAEKQPLVLRRSIEVGPRDAWLWIPAFVWHDYSDRTKVRVRIDGRAIPQMEFPVNSGGTADVTGPVVSLLPYRGHRIDVELEQSAADPRLGVSWNALGPVEQLPVLRSLLEDSIELPPAQPAGPPAAAWVDEHYTGRRSLKVPAGCRVHLGPFDPPIRVRSSPDAGAARYLRVAVRKPGGGRACVELHTADPQQKTLGYMLGKGEMCLEGGKRGFNDELCDGWVVVSRDLYDDFRDRDLTDVVLSVPDGDYALFDHVYLARWSHHFELLRRLPPPETVQPAWRAGRLDEIRKSKLPGLVRIEIDGRVATGIFVSGGEYVLTAGHVVIRPGREAVVELTDRRRLAATTAGVDRDCDCGLLKLAEKIDVPSASIGDWGSYMDTNMLVAAARGKADETGSATGVSAVRDGAAVSQVRPTWITSTFDDVLWTDFEAADDAVGSPLMNHDGWLVGVRVGASRFGGSYYAVAKPARDQWDRLTRGEVFGQWLLGAGPTLGATLAGDGAACRVTDVPAAEAAGLRAGDVIDTVEGRPVLWPHDVDAAVGERDPGDEANVEVSRGGQKLSLRLRLAPRIP